MVSIQHSTNIHGDFLILNFQNSLLILCLMEKYVFNSNVHQTLATTCKTYFLYSMLLPSSQIAPIGAPPIIQEWYQISIALELGKDYILYSNILAVWNKQIHSQVKLGKQSSFILEIAVSFC